MGDVLGAEASTLPLPACCYQCLCPHKPTKPLAPLPACLPACLLGLQDPREASIALFSKDAISLSFTLTWWAYFYLPAGLGPTVASLAPVRSGAKVARAILRANQIVQRVNAAVKLFPGLVGAPLVLGTLAGSGGKLLTDAFSRCAGYPSAGADWDTLARHSALACATELLLFLTCCCAAHQTEFAVVLLVWLIQNLLCVRTPSPLQAPPSCTSHPTCCALRHCWLRCSTAWCTRWAC